MTQNGFSKKIIIDKSYTLESGKELSGLKQLLLTSHIHSEFGEPIMFTDKVTIHSTLYRLGDIILVDHKIKLFGKICKIIPNNDKSDVFFLYYEILSAFDEHLMAYELTTSAVKKGFLHNHNCIVIKLSQLFCILIKVLLYVSIKSSWPFLHKIRFCSLFISDFL